MRYGRWAIWMCALLVSAGVYGQDMQFSQPYSNPLYLNPAFAGTGSPMRVVLNYRNQWPGIDKAYSAFAASADMDVHDINGGIGISCFKDIAGTHNLSTTLASLYYAQHLRISRRSNLSLGLKGSFGQRAFNPDNLVFADQIIRESASSLTQMGMTESVAYADFSAGMLYFTQRLWLGVSMHRINEPNQSLRGGQDIIPRKLSVHGGIKVPVKSFEKSHGEKQLRIAFNYKQQGNWNQLDLGGYYTYRNFNFGMWYRGLPLKAYKPGYANNESVILLVGYESPSRFSFGYSYDITINRLFTYSAGAHEISLIMDFQAHKSKKRRVVPCAKF